MNRLDKIIQMVSEAQRVNVNHLSEKLKVSKVTIRKDLDKLESKGLLRREHGYAVLNSGDDLNVRLSYHYRVKRKIAEQAAQLIGDNDTIMIESGSTCALLAEVLCQTKRNIKIITNSCFIANHVRQHANCQVILLGGNYQPSSEVTVGPLLKEMLNLFHVDHLFVGTDGFAAETGFMGKDMMRSEVVRYMSGVADKTIILTDSSKFQKTSLVNQLSIEKVYGVITDKDLDPNISRFLTEKGIQLTFV
ncbi:DeoR/GlpR family DNA-binding transcription regulator [Streptococcus iniae]|uniref:Lactose phosphotransferase system repressor n=1 Tax=Streptococcus iniae TaxID=1346 RepID=A0A3L8GRS6_STRIN|nr:DeoR/GlpR family DNA-binding transcription regulator [Streptococcus iniae]AGM97995.1 transcriptional regulator [Streptococcus iniae SF1]AHY15072.1 DeoR faimly transcriptional regulator [Streptococcus iniae]AHY16943.1 DeoR faimly transcriptional regulator [Streptococcus iniae]AJG25229.1 DeoR faimly transcriptional regulator [Streptococcus iniae]APD31133.1 DeoR family transcriptional regulator [Streptococcus iniae]